jgi:hypothetical protein
VLLGPNPRRVYQLHLAQALDLNAMQKKRGTSEKRARKGKNKPSLSHQTRPKIDASDAFLLMGSIN